LFSAQDGEPSLSGQLVQRILHDGANQAVAVPVSGTRPRHIAVARHYRVDSRWAGANTFPRYRDP
jgi:hypothetical protein